MPASMRTLLRDAHGLIAEFDRRALVMVWLGLAMGALDIVVPLVGSHAIDAMVAGRPFSDVAWLILLFGPLVWIPHGNILPWLVQVYDLRRYRLPLAEKLAAETFRRALARPGDAGEALLVQPILSEGCEGLERLAGKLVREIPVLIRALAILGLLTVMVPVFVPVLVGFGLLDLAITLWAGHCCRERFRRRDLAVKRQRRVLLALLGRRRDARAGRCYAAAVGRRVEAERKAEIAAAHYKLVRDLIANASNLVVWVFGAWFVLVAGHPVGTFLFFVAWSSRAGDLFGSLMGIQAEFMRARHALEQLVAI